MLTAEQPNPAPLSAAALAALKAHLGLNGDTKDALLSAQLRAALSLCEAFTGQILLHRKFRHRLVMHHAPQYLPHVPVTAIISVGRYSVQPDNPSSAIPTTARSVTALPVSAYRIDIDGAQKGQVTLNGPLPQLAQGDYIAAEYLAGLASEWTYLPEALRQGILLLAAHLYDQPRDGAARNGGHQPPAAVTALWRPWRRLRLG